MTDRDTIHQDIDRIVEQYVTYPGEDVDVPSYLATLQELWLLLSWAQRYRDAAKAVMDSIEADIAVALGQGGGVVFGDELVRYSHPAKYKPLDGMKTWLDTLPAEEVTAILPLRNFRKRALEAIAGVHGMSKDALEGTFYLDLRDETKATISRMPVSHADAPKYAQTMVEGEVRPGRQRKEPT